MGTVAEHTDAQIASVSMVESLRERMDLTVKRLQVPQEQILEIVTQLSIMFETGLNLSSALEVLEKQCSSPHLGRFVGSIRNSVEEGDYIPYFEVIYYPN